MRDCEHAWRFDCETEHGVWFRCVYCDARSFSRDGAVRTEGGS
jgi:hypothetical protein